MTWLNDFHDGLTFFLCLRGREEEGWKHYSKRGGESWMWGGCNLHDHHSRTTSGWDMVYLVFVWPTIPFMVHHWPEYSGLTMAINVCSEYYRLPDFLACWKNCWIQLCKHEVWFSEVSSPWTFYTMTWQKSVEFLQRRNLAWEFCKLDTNNLFR